MWEEMQADWEQFVIKSQQATAEFEATIDDTFIPDEIIDYTGSNKTAQTTVRVGQDFFRRSVLSAYNFRCCIKDWLYPSCW